MDLNTTLLNAQNPDQAIRTAAEAQLTLAVEQQYGPFLLALCSELATEGKHEANRQLAGLYMKNLITAQDVQIMAAKANKWMECDPAIKEQVKAGLLQALLCPLKTVSHTAAQVVAAFGAIDVPNGAWESLLPQLFTNVSSPDAPLFARVASLEALGYLCEEMDPDSVEKGVVDVILNTIVDGMRPDRDDEIRRAAVGAMCNSLHFTEKNFEIEGERNAIMQVVCEATQCTDIRVRVKAFECIATVAGLYYTKLQQYMDALFNLTAGAIKGDDEKVGLQAIEFWSTICDTETEIMELLEDNPSENIVFLRIAEQAATQIIPLLLETLTHQDEDNTDSESWNIAMAGSTCLQSLSITIGDHVVDLVIPFISANISDSNWRLKEASVMAFASIMEGPSEKKLTPIVASALPMILECLKDGSAHVRDTAAWTVGRMCEFHKGAISADMIPHLFHMLANSLDDSEAQVAAQGCFAFHSLAAACADDSEADTNALSMYMPTVLTKLFAVTNREDWEEHNLRSTAYEAINMMVEASALDMAGTVGLVLTEALGRLEQTFLQSDHTHRMQNQAMLCSLVGVCVQKLSKDEIIAVADRIMTLTLQVFTTKGAVAHEDAFMTVGYFADKLGTDFQRYIDYFIPALMTGLSNVEEHQVCTCAVGVVGDLCRALGPQMMPHCDHIVQSLLTLLQSDVLSRVVKPQVIAAFADIAMAIEGQFTRYSSVVLTMLQQAGDMNITTEDEEIIEYINSLREAILEAYSGIIQGLTEDNKQDAVNPFVEKMVDFIRRCSEDCLTESHSNSGVLKALIALLGDLGAFFGRKVVAVLTAPYVVQVLRLGNEDSDLKAITEFTQGIINKLQRH